MKLNNPQFLYFETIFCISRSKQDFEMYVLGHKREQTEAFESISSVPLNTVMRVGHAQMIKNTSP